MVTLTSVPFYRLRKRGVNGGPQSGSRPLGEKGTDRAIILMCGICVRLVCGGGYIHSVFCLTTGPKPPPKRCLHIVRSRASSFKWEYPLLTLRSSSSFLRLLPHLLATSISPFIFPSITCFRRQFLRKMWPIQLAFRFLISCRIFLCSLCYGKCKSVQIFGKRIS